MARVARLRRWHGRVVRVALQTGHPLDSFPHCIESRTASLGRQDGFHSVNEIPKIALRFAEYSASSPCLHESQRTSVVHGWSASCFLDVPLPPVLFLQ